MKIGKIHVIYVYIKNQKQTDELPKSQVGFVLGEVWLASSVLLGACAAQLAGGPEPRFDRKFVTEKVINTSDGHQTIF